MSVFPIPHVPTDGQVVVEAKRVFLLQEAISRPVGFTTCVARRVMLPYLDHDVVLDQDTDWDMDNDWDWDWDGQREPCLAPAPCMSPTLTIAARWRRRPEGVSMLMLIPLVDQEGRPRAANAGTSAFPYRLASLPPHMASTSEWKYASQGGEDRMQACTTLCLGSSGRGVFVVGRELRLVSPGLHILPPYEMQVGPVFETGPALYRVDQSRQRDSNWSYLSANEGGVSEWDVSEDKVDFDEGMGRFVVAKGRGGFEVVQLD